MSSWSFLSDASAASVAGGRCADDSSGLTFMRSLATPSRPGVAPPIERFSFTARLKRVTRRELAVEEVDAADFHLGGRAVGDADDGAGDADQGEVVVELVEDVFDLGGGDAVHREDGGHRVGVGGPGGVGGDGRFGQAGASTASESPVTSIRSSSSRVEQSARGGEAEPAAGIFGDDQSAVVGELRRGAAVFDFDDGGGFVVVADRAGGERAGGRARRGVRRRRAWRRRSSAASATSAPRLRSVVADLHRAAAFELDRDLGEVARRRRAA